MHENERIESQGTSATIPKSRSSRRRRTYKYGYRSWEPVNTVSRVLKFDNDEESERVKEAEFEIIEELFVTYVTFDVSVYSAENDHNRYKFAPVRVQAFV